MKCGGLLLVLVLGWACPLVAAQTAHRRSPYVGAIAIDATTGRVLLSDNARKECYPASCTKLMTIYVTLEAVKAGVVQLTDIVGTTRESVCEPPSATGLLPGDALSLQDLLKALMVKSANDGAVMIAQHVASKGSGAPQSGVARLKRFVQLMNATAKRLGLKNTVFASPNGLPPPKGSSRGFDRSTAEDLSLLAQCLLRDHPEVLEYTSLAGCAIKSHRGSRLVYQNHNDFLWKKGVKLSEVDGLKTGYIDAGGSSIVLTGRRNGRRAIVVVTGSATKAERDREAGRLMLDALGALGW